MRRLFIQFYLLLIGCFGLAILLIGLVYQVSAERAGDRYLEHMMQGSLGLLTGELARLPPARWPARMGEQSQQLNLPLQLGALANQPLAREDQAFLEAGNIVIVEEDDTFLQRIPGTDQVLIVGPVPYLSYLHELHWVDVGLLLLIGLSLGLPILLWLRPHWHGLQRLEQTARRVGDGDLSCRTGLPPGSSLGRGAAPGLAGAAPGQTTRPPASRPSPALARRHPPAGQGAGEPHRQRPAPRHQPGEPHHESAAGSLSAGGGRRRPRHRSGAGTPDLRALRAAGSEPGQAHWRHGLRPRHSAQHSAPPRRRGAVAARRDGSPLLPQAARTFGYKPSPATH